MTATALSAIAGEQCRPRGVVDDVVRRAEQLAEPLVGDGVAQGAKRGEGQSVGCGVSS